MIEDELRATFARYETLTPDPEPLRFAIATTAVRRRRRQRLIRGAASALAVVLAVSTPVLARTLAQPSAEPTRPAGPVASDLLSQQADPLPAGPLNFLLLGVDAWSGREHGLRSDTVLIVHVPRERRQAYLVSLPRDLGVEIPGRGFDKLNAAFFYGTKPGARSAGARPDLAAGADLTARTVTALTGLRFDGRAVITYDGLRAVTDAVGGVHMCLPMAVRSVHTGRSFPAGCQQLDGPAALDLLRQRRGLPEGSHDRDRTGHRFAAALLDRVAGQDALRNPVNLAGLLRVMGDQVSVDIGDASLPEFVSVLASVASADPVGIGWSLNSQTVDGVAYERLDPVVSGELFEALRAGTVADWVLRHPEQITR